MTSLSRNFIILLLAGGLLSGITFCQAQNVEGLFTGKHDSIEQVDLPDGFSLRVERQTHFIYTAPKDFKNNPIHLIFKKKPGKPKRPDVLVWADEIHWYKDIQEGTASGRIIVDDQREYRIETTYVDFNRKTGQIYCPRRTKVIWRSETGPDSYMTAGKVTLTYDDEGVKTVNFVNIEESEFHPENKKEKPRSGRSLDRGKKTTKTFDEKKPRIPENKGINKRKNRLAPLAD